MIKNNLVQEKVFTSRKRVLLSGVGGFSGSHFLDYILETTDWEIVGIASWKHKGLPERISDSEIYQNNKERVTIITHDLESPFNEITKKRIGHIDYIINIASMSDVENSILNPVPFIQNNVSLILNMLELAKEIKPEIFIQISTDETSGPMLNNEPHKEWSSTLPSNPYAASKAAQEAICISYWRTYGVPIIITNTMNLIGTRQDSVKFLPKIIKYVLEGKEIPIYADVNGVFGSRFYIDVRNQVDAILYIIKNTIPASYENGALRPDRYNVVGEKQFNNLEFAQLVANIAGKELKYKTISFYSNTERKGHDMAYGLSGEKLKSIGWNYPVSLEESLRGIVEWYINNPEWL